MKVRPGSRAAALTCMSLPLVNPSHCPVTTQQSSNADKLLAERTQTMSSPNSQHIQYQNRDAPLILDLLAAVIVSSASS